MIKKIGITCVIIFLFFGCTSVKTERTKDFIFYNFSQEVNEKINSILQDFSGCSDKIYCMIYSYEENDLFQFSFNCLDLNQSKRIENILTKTNRYIQIEDGKTIPIIYRSDILFVKDKNNILIRKSGGSKSLMINGQGELIFELNSF